MRDVTDFHVRNSSLYISLSSSSRLNHLFRFPEELDARLVDASSLPSLVTWTCVNLACVMT